MSAIWAEAVHVRRELTVRWRALPLFGAPAACRMPGEQQQHHMQGGQCMATELGLLTSTASLETAADDAVMMFVIF